MPRCNYSFHMNQKSEKDIKCQLAQYNYTHGHGEFIKPWKLYNIIIINTNN